MRYFLAVVLYTALAATANADMSDLEALRAGDMRKLQIHSAARPAAKRCQSFPPFKRPWAALI